MPPPSQRPTHKRSRSSTETFDLILPYDTKRARKGIQKLTTDAIPLRNSRASSSSGPESRSEGDYTSSSLDSEETSSSEDESSDGRGIDEGYDSDSESGSTTTSSSSSSSGEDDSEDEGEREERSVIGGVGSVGRSRGEGRMMAMPSTSLAEKLDAFLPRMAAANVKLERAKKKGLLGVSNIEEVDEEGQYIEMNLGLGVLEEKRDGVSGGSDNDGDESDAGSTRSKSTTKSSRNNTMDVLMGRKGVRRPNIQVVEV